MSDTDWRDDAACADMDPALWGVGPEDVDSTTDQIVEGRAICNRCPVSADCLTDALLPLIDGGVREQGGTRGALTGTERYRLIRKKTRTEIPASIYHVITPEEHQQRLQLVADGLTDAAIARTLGTAKSTIYTWRKRYKVETNWDAARFATGDKKRRELYDRGMTDADIARHLNISADSVSRWRGRRNLPPQCRKVTA